MIKIPNCGPGRHAFLGPTWFHRKVRTLTGALERSQLPVIPEDSWLRLWSKQYPLPESNHPFLHPVSGPPEEVSQPSTLQASIVGNMRSLEERCQMSFSSAKIVLQRSPVWETLGRKSWRVGKKQNKAKQKKPNASQPVGQFLLQVATRWHLKASTQARLFPTSCGSWQIVTPLGNDEPTQDSGLLSH